MSIFSKISTILSIVPDKMGFFGYTWEVVGSFLLWIGMFLFNAFYQVCKWFLAFVDFLQYFIQKLIGLDYWLSPGDKTIKGATDSDLLFSFLYNETVQNVFRALIGLFIVLLLVFTIFAIIRQEWQFATGAKGASDNSKTTIIRSSLKAIGLVLVVPIMLILGVVSSNAILASIVKALSIDMSTSFGNTIFSVSAVSANRYRIYTDSKKRSPIVSNVTFTVDSNGKQILFGSVRMSDEYSETYNDYQEYRAKIKAGDTYTVDSMFKIIKTTDEENFAGFCVRINENGTNTYYMVKANTGSESATRNEIWGTYYYLKNILKADIMTRKDNIGSRPIQEALRNSFASGANSPEGFVSDFNLDGCGVKEVYDASYNTWSYASIFRTTTDFELTTASTTIDPQTFGIVGSSTARLPYNAYEYGNYFDGGQFGLVNLNAEYGVMTDVIDFMCETGANLFILDATSPLINWNYEGYSVGTNYVSEMQGKSPKLYDADGNAGTTNDRYMPFIVDYSDTALTHEQGKMLYLAKENSGNELDGAKFIMCWKTSSVDGGLSYIPLVHRETYTDPITKQSYYFSSEYLSNNYRGLVLAKGNFDATNFTSSDIGNGDPTYLKMGAKLEDGDAALEYENEPYYYDITKGNALEQRVTLQTKELDGTLTNIIFDNDEFQNYTIEFDSTNKGQFRFVDTVGNSYLDTTEYLINKLSLRMTDGTKDYSFSYLGKNDGNNYLFASSTGFVLNVFKLDAKTLMVNGIDKYGQFSSNATVPSEVSPGAGSASNVKSVNFYYTATLSYGGRTQTEDINPSDLEYARTSGGKSLFSTKDKVFVSMGDINQYMTIGFYFENSSIYNIDSMTSRLQMATPSTETYNLQMFKLSLYDFMVGSFSGGIYRYDTSTNSAVGVTSDDIIESYSFGVLQDEFAWENNDTEYVVYNGAQVVAKLIKSKGDAFAFENLAGTSSKTIAIEISGNKYFNVRTQNKFADKQEMEEKYALINKSMYVGCYRDRISTDTIFDVSLKFWSWDEVRFNWKFNQPMVEKNYLMTSDFNEGIFSLAGGIQFDYFFEGDNSIMQFYNVYKVAYWIILISAALIIKTLGTALWGVIRRFYEITLNYLALPVLASTMPLDGGSKFSKVQGNLISYTLSTYGVILGINVFFVLLSPIKSMSNIFTQAEMASSTSYFLKHFPFGAKILNNYVYILFILVAFTMIDSLVKTIPELIGAKDIKSMGAETKQNAGKVMTDATNMISGRSFMDGAKTVAKTVTDLPMMAPVKAAVGWGKRRVDGVIGAFNKGASQTQDDADAEAGGEKKADKSSRADGSGESGAQTSSRTGETSSDADESQEFENEQTGADAEETSNEAKAEQEAEKEYNKQAHESMSEEDKQASRADAMRDMAQNGTNSTVVSQAASNIVGGATNISAENAAAVGLNEDQVIALIRQILGETAKDMSDEDIKKNYSLNTSKDLMGNLQASISNKETGETTQLSDAQTTTLASGIVANASSEKLAEAFNGLDSEEQDTINSAAASGSANISFDSFETANVDALKLMEAHKGDEDVENAVILEKLKNSGALDRFETEAGLGYGYSEAEALAAIAKMKKLDDPNAVNQVLSNMSGKLDADYAKVIKAKVDSGAIKETAWSLASDAEKQEFMAKRKKDKGEFTNEEKAIETELKLEAVDNLAKTNADDYSKRVMEAFVENGNIENKAAIVDKLIMESSGLNDKASAEYKAAVAEIEKVAAASGGALNLKALAKQGISTNDMLAAYAKLKLVSGGKAVDAKALSDMLGNRNTLSADVLKAMTKNSKANGVMAKMLMDGDAGTMPLLTEDDQNALKQTIANVKSLLPTYDEVVAESKKREKVDAVFNSQGSRIGADELNKFANNDELAAQLTGAILGKDAFHLSELVRDKEEIANLFKQLSGDESVDKNNFNSKYGIVSKIDENGNNVLKLGIKNRNGNVTGERELSPEQLELLASTVMSKFDVSKVGAEKLSIIKSNLGGSASKKIDGFGVDFAAAIEKIANGDTLNNANYKLLLDEINKMRAEAGEDAVSKISDDDLAKLINNEDNVGYDPIELINLRKEIISSKIGNGEEFSAIVNADTLSVKDKDAFDYKKAIVEEQMSGENGKDVLANLFNNSNFVGKDEIMAIVSEILEKQGISDIKNASANQLSDAISKALEGKDDIKQTLAEIGATDLTKALNSDSLFEKQKEAVANDAVLQKQLSDAGIKAGEADYDKKLKDFIAQNGQTAFGARLSGNVQGFIDPSKQVSDEDKQRFFESKSMADTGIVGAGAALKNGAFGVKDAFDDFIKNNAKDQNAGAVRKLGSAVWNKTAGGAIQKGKDRWSEAMFRSGGNAELALADVIATPIAKIGKKGVQAVAYKFTKALPKEHEKYDEWNKILDSDIEAVKSGKGQYKDYSKEERQAKIDELKAKKILKDKPADFYSWSNEEQTEFVKNQNVLKNEAFNMRMSAIKKQQKELTAVKGRNRLLKAADQLGYSIENVDGKFGKTLLFPARLLVSKAPTAGLKQKHEQDLILAEANITRFNSTAPMRSKSRDFGSEFDSFARTYFDEKTVENMKKRLEKQGISQSSNSAAAIKAREEMFAKEINKQYKVASAKVARDKGLKPETYLTEKGVNAGSVRFKDGTKKFSQVESRISVLPFGLNAVANKIVTGKRKKAIKEYEEEFARTNGNVSDKTREKYYRSYYGKRSEQAAIRSQNEARAQERLYKDMIEFNKNFKGTKADYEAAFKKQFGAEGEKLYKLYNKKLNAGAAGSKAANFSMNLENSPTIVQQRELLKQLQREIKKNYDRQKLASAFIPASELAKAKFASQSLSNKRSKVAVAMDKQIATQYNEALKEFVKNSGNAGATVDKLLAEMKPAIRDQFEAKLSEIKKFKAEYNKMSNADQMKYLQNFLESNLDKYNKRAHNNTFTPSQMEDLTKLGGVLVNKALASKTRISPTVLKSLNATDGEVYKNLVKNLNKAQASVNAENINQENLRKALASVQSGIQNNAAKEQAEKIKRAIRNSEIKLDNLKMVRDSEEERKKEFERAIADERNKLAKAANMKAMQSAKAESDYYARFKGPKGAVNFSELSPAQKRQVKKIMDDFSNTLKSNVDSLMQTVKNNISKEVASEIQDAIGKVDKKFINNYNNLVNMQKRLNMLITKKGKKSDREIQQLTIEKNKLDRNLKELKKRIQELGLDV